MKNVRAGFIPSTCEDLGLLAVQWGVRKCGDIAIWGYGFIDLALMIRRKTMSLVFARWQSSILLKSFEDLGRVTRRDHIANLVCFLFRTKHRTMYRTIHCLGTDLLRGNSRKTLIDFHAAISPL